MATPTQLHRTPQQPLINHPDPPSKQLWPHNHTENPNNHLATTQDTLKPHDLTTQNTLTTT